MLGSFRPKSKTLLSRDHSKKLKMALARPTQNELENQYFGNYWGFLGVLKTFCRISQNILISKRYRRVFQVRESRPTSRGVLTLDPTALLSRSHVSRQSLQPEPKFLVSFFTWNITYFKYYIYIINKIYNNSRQLNDSNFQITK